jgi:hypothetical protein
MAITLFRARQDVPHSAHRFNPGEIGLSNQELLTINRILRRKKKRFCQTIPLILRVATFFQCLRAAVIKKPPVSTVKIDIKNNIFCRE